MFPKFIGFANGFAHSTRVETRPSPFLNEIPGLNIDYDTGMWRSPVTVDLIEEDILQYENPSPRPQSRNLDEAIRHVASQFRLPERVKMLHLNDVFDQDLEIWNKSPGLPWKDIGYRTKGDIRRDPEAIRHVRKFWHLVKGGECLSPPDCMAYTRAHLAPIGERKVRAIWGYPATMTFGEAVFAIPLIEGFKKHPHRPIAYGYEMMTGGMKFVRSRFERFRYKIGIDFRRFDKTVPAWLISIAFKILMQNVDFGKYLDYGTADARRMLLMWTYIKYYFTHTKIRLQTGKRFQKRSGVASGSYFTQLIGSVVNAICINWFSLEQFQKKPDDAVYLGDDSFFGMDRKWDLTHSGRIAARIGMEVNVEKSQVERDYYKIKFLGFYLGRGIPFKPIAEWMASLMFPERPDREFADLQSRALGLYYACMGASEEFSRICYTLIRFRPFQLALSRNFERALIHMGCRLEDLSINTLPTPYEFAARYL